MCLILKITRAYVVKHNLKITPFAAQYGHKPQYALDLVSLLPDAQVKIKMQVICSTCKNYYKEKVDKDRKFNKFI